MILKEQEFINNSILEIAKQMCLAAKTAPKAKGLDLISTAILTGGSITEISNKMLEIGQRLDHKTFLRDGKNILSAQALVLIGTSKQTIGLKYCGFCGFANCAACEKADGVCAYNSGDLGIALGSAVSVATDHRVDNRIMYSVGKAAIELKLMGDKISIAYGIPLSASSKNPFFDR